MLVLKIVSRPDIIHRFNFDTIIGYKHDTKFREVVVLLPDTDELIIHDVDKVRLYEPNKY